MVKIPGKEPAFDAIGRMAGWVRIPMYLNFSGFEER